MNKRVNIAIFMKSQTLEPNNYHKKKKTQIQIMSISSSLHRVCFQWQQRKEKLTQRYKSEIMLKQQKEDKY